MDSVSDDYKRVQVQDNARVEVFQDVMSNGLLGGVATRNKLLRPNLDAAINEMTMQMPTAAEEQSYTVEEVNRNPRAHPRQERGVR